jgi:hypothetical protein
MCSYLVCFRSVWRFTVSQKMLIPYLIPIIAGHKRNCWWLQAIWLCSSRWRGIEILVFVFFKSVFNWMLCSVVLPSHSLRLLPFKVLMSCKQSNWMLLVLLNFTYEDKTCSIASCYYLMFQICLDLWVPPVIFCMFCGVWILESRFILIGILFNQH